ncbi:MAG: methyl-accepting chemotaxis protein [Desulforhopalus sp.]
MKIRASINSKINGLVICSLLILGIVSVTISSYSLIDRGEEEVSGYRNAIMEEKKAMLTYLVAAAYNIAQYNYKESQKSTGTDLKAKALNEINTLRYGKDGADYFYTLDTATAKMLQHPKESLVGKAANFFKDPDGKQFIVSQIDIARGKGDGFDEYKWSKLGEKEPQPKLSYVKHFREWNMAIVTGMYTDDVDKAIAVKKEAISAAIRTQIYWQGGVVIGLILLAIGLTYPIVSIGIVKPIHTMIAMLKDIAEGEGDLTKRIIDNSGDETEEMAGWFNQFVGKVQNIIRDVAENAGTLYNSSQSLTTVSKQMATNAAQTSDTANSVAAASEQMSANMQSVAAAMEEASTNVSMVAAATEQMSSTINEIAENTEKARDITGSAVAKTQSASSQVGELGRAAREIGKVVETITEISSQVDLLALNATIEAARAGDAGKGFAVVAGEIKELARQTAEASGEIKDRVEGIQTNTEGTVSEINDVSEVVNEINAIVATIASAVEEQSATTSEIVSNVSQASVGLTEVNENVAQSSQVSSEIARDINDVTRSSGDISKGCSEVNTSSEELAALAEQLNQMVNTFKV